MAETKKTSKKVIKKNSKKTSKKVVKQTPKKAKSQKKPELKKLPKEENTVTKNNSRKINQNIAIIALLLNIIIIPGLGTLIGKRKKEGTWQLILVIGGLFIGILLSGIKGGVIIGVPLMILAPLAAWIWGIISGVELIKESS